MFISSHIANLFFLFPHASISLSPLSLNSGSGNPHSKHMSIISLVPVPHCLMNFSKRNISQSVETDFQSSSLPFDSMPRLTPMTSPEIAVETVDFHPTVRHAATQTRLGHNANEPRLNQYSTAVSDISDRHNRHERKE